MSSKERRPIEMTYRQCKEYIDNHGLPPLLIVPIGNTPGERERSRLEAMQLIIAVHRLHGKEWRDYLPNHPALEAYRPRLL